MPAIGYAIVSTLTEIREAIGQLDEQDRYLLIAELLANVPEPDENDPSLIEALARGVADDEADRVYSLEEVRVLIPQWITPSHSQKTP